MQIPDPEVVREIATNLWKMGLQPTNKIRFEDENDKEGELVQLARHIATSEHAEAFVRGVVIAENPKMGPEVEALRQKFLADYKDSVFDIKVRGRGRGKSAHVSRILLQQVANLFWVESFFFFFFFRVHSFIFIHYCTCLPR